MKIIGQRFLKIMIKLERNKNRPNNNCCLVAPKLTCSNTLLLGSYNISLFYRIDRTQMPPHETKPDKMSSLNKSLVSTPPTAENIDSFLIEVIV